jgi:D-glycero-alpha-D-manno-heptose-7-phosphate kinase
MPYTEGWVKISSEGFIRGEKFRYRNLPFDTRFGIFFAAVSHFGFHGLHIAIHSQSPVKSALGGSSTALVSMIKALAKVSVILGNRMLSAKQILHLGHHLEDGISGGNCGLQDQAAAVYGGVNQWTWHYGAQTRLYTKEPLLDKEGQKELSSRILVAYSGMSHISSRTNRKWIKDFLSGRTRQGWIEANRLVQRLGEAVRKKDWPMAAHLLNKEMQLRKSLTPEALIPLTEKLLDQAERLKCGARFAGAGAGGSVWALGPQQKIKSLRKKWQETLRSERGAKILSCQVDGSGVR